MKTLIGESLYFGEIGNAADSQLYGWSPPEYDYTWTIGKESAFRIRVPPSRHGFFLEFLWRPFTHPPRLGGQPITVSVNGFRLKVLELRHDGLTAIKCPPLPNGEQWACVTLHHPEAARPSDIFGHHDTRQLAICIRRIRVLPIESTYELVAPRHSRVVLSDGKIGGLISQIEAASGVSVSELVTEFEMISGNCDMGLVQREVGAEPLSLLRFAGATPEVAIRGLDSQFNGIGETLTPEVSADSDREWMISDSYGLRYHTGHSSNAIGPDEMVARERQKISFLKRKLLEDLSEGKKTFVFADPDGLPIEGMLPLFLALNRHGVRRLLWVTHVCHPTLRGMVQEVYPNLYYGGLDAFAPPLIAGHISAGGWLALLYNAWLLQRNEF